MRIGENIYKTILLDTNAIREIVLNNNNCGYNFLDKIINGEVKYAPCFSIYNVLELKPYANIYEKFIETFSFIPCLMLFPYKSFLEIEYLYSLKNEKVLITNGLANAFSMLGRDSSYNIRLFMQRLFEDKDTFTTLQKEIVGLKEVADEWNKQRADAMKLLSRMGLHERILNDKYYKCVERETILKDLRKHEINASENIMITKLPGARIMEYSHFNRVYKTKKLIKPNDVMDVKISCAIPYVDAVITENYQADVYKKSKSFINGLEQLEVYRLKDIKQHV